eukprot:1390662-Pleurochrysis_carterae.AAC.1
MLSILLNIAAFGTAIAIGTKQLWDNGASLPPSHRGLMVTASPAIVLLLVLLSRASLRPRAPTLRTQATDDLNTSAQPPTLPRFAP